MLMPLDMIRPGETAEVYEVSGDAGWVGRLADLGLRQGCRVEVLQPGATCLLRVAGCSKICLRNGECAQIMVRPVTN